jgi:hypothetical protein
MAHVHTLGGRVLAPPRSKVVAKPLPRAVQRGELTRVSLPSVARVAIAFWTCVGALIAGGLLALTAFLSAAGAIDKVESFVADLTGADEFRIMSGSILVALLLLVAAFVIVATTLSVAAAAFYNVMSHFTGGIEITLTQQVGSAANNGHADVESVS